MTHLIEPLHVRAEETSKRNTLNSIHKPATVPIKRRNTGAAAPPPATIVFSLLPNHPHLLFRHWKLEPPFRAIWRQP